MRRIKSLGKPDMDTSISYSQCFPVAPVVKFFFSIQNPKSKIQNKFYQHVYSAILAESFL